MTLGLASRVCPTSSEVRRRVETTLKTVVLTLGFVIKLDLL